MSNQSLKEKKQKPEMSVKAQHAALKIANQDSKTDLKNWKQFNALTQYLNQFKEISPNNALSNASELTKLVKDFKKSVINNLNYSAFKARLNVLESEVLRLNDMSKISAIKAKEVNTQVDKIIAIYNSSIIKINTSYQTKRYDKEVDLSSFFKLEKQQQPKQKKARKIYEYDD